MATIKDVAKLAGVSVATVSRVINRNGYVNKETEEKIAACIKTLNFKPNSLARALTRKKTEMIALIIPDVTNPFFAELARAIEDTAASMGYTLILGNSYSIGENEMRYIEIFKDRYVDGIIFATHRLRTNEMNELIHLGIPIVTLDRAPNIEEFPSIYVNHYTGSVMGVEHLISIGCRQIAHITGPLHLRTSMERLKGYKDTLESHRLFHEPLIKEGDFTLECGLQATLELMAEFPEIDGIFAGNDLIAIGALKALLRLGKKVPDDVAILGFDGIRLSSVIEPEISTVAQPIDQMGQLAVYQLIRLIDNKEVSDRNSKELQAELIQRASTLRG